MLHGKYRIFHHTDSRHPNGLHFIMIYGLITNLYKNTISTQKWLGSYLINLINSGIVCLSLRLMKYDFDTCKHSWITSKWFFEWLKKLNTAALHNILCKRFIRWHAQSWCHWNLEVATKWLILYRRHLGMFQWKCDSNFTEVCFEDTIADERGNSRDARSAVFLWRLHISCVRPAPAQNMW